MRIHTNLTWQQMHDVRTASGAPISFEAMTEHNSRTHPRAFEIRLEGTGGRNNTGHYGAGDYNGATWDEWGAFFGALYDADPDARCGGTSKRPAYARADHYHFETGHRFHKRQDAGMDRPTYLPRDTHPRHRWEFVGVYGRGTGLADWECSKCGATRPGFGASETFREEMI